MLGASDGDADGLSLGLVLGDRDGLVDGLRDGLVDGKTLGDADGLKLGLVDGLVLGLALANDAQALLRPAPNDDVEFHAVSKHVNNVRNDDPGCIEPLSEDQDSDV